MNALKFAALAALLATPALAQTTAPDAHAGHTAPTPAADAATSATAPATAETALAAAMERMHKDMMVPPTGDADVDFVRGMIPHHQGAIDMARIQLQFGKDPALHKLSESIIAAQEREIAEMQAWLAQNAPQAAQPAPAGTEPPKPAADGTPVPSPAGEPAAKPAN